MEVDAPSTSEASQQPQQPQQVFSLNILALIKTAQGQNGLKHGDYTRYRWVPVQASPTVCWRSCSVTRSRWTCRRHCANRLHGLFKALKWQHGRTKYVNRKLEPHHVTDVR